MWPTGRPLTIVGSEILVKTAAEGGTRSFPNVIGLYESLVIFKAEVLFDTRLGVRSTACTAI